MDNKRGNVSIVLVVQSMQFGFGCVRATRCFFGGKLYIGHIGILVVFCDLCIRNVGGFPYLV